MGFCRSTRRRLLPNGAASLTIFLFQLHLCPASADFFPFIRLFSSASGATAPEYPAFNCKVNKTLTVRDLVKVAQQDRIFLTLEDNTALRFTAGSRAYFTDGFDKPPIEMNFDSCAVVGNGGVLKLSNYGANIDSHTVVFRTNQAPTQNYEEYVGTKTTFRVVNKHWLIKYSTGGPVWIPKEDGLVLVMGRGEDALMRKTAAYFSNKLLYTVKMGGQVGSRARTLLTKYRERRKCIDKTTFVGGATPTSGLYQVIMALSLCKKVTVYGFGDGGQGLYQYYQFFNTERLFGNTVVHSFTAEKALVQKMHKEGFLTVCNSKSAPDCGCQNPDGCTLTSPRGSLSPEGGPRGSSAGGQPYGGAPKGWLAEGGSKSGLEHSSASAALSTGLAKFKIAREDIDNILNVIGDER